MQFLNGGETDIDILWIHPLKIADRRDGNPPVVNYDRFIEKVFTGCGVEKIITGLFNDIGGIDKKKEITVTLFIKKQD